MSAVTTATAGVLRVLGPRDLAEGLVTVVRRDSGTKQQVAVPEAHASALLARILGLAP